MHDLWGLEHLTAFTVSLPWFLEVEQFQQSRVPAETKTNL